MAVADLYGVTASLRNLIRFNIWRIANIVVTVGDVPPEKADELANNSLNLHLFHATEDPSKRNEFPLDSIGGFPISEAPLPLVLYYVLTAHNLTADPDVPGQQRLMGLAMKTLHDFPEFAETLEMPTPPANVVQPVFDLAMRGADNRIAVAPRQLTPEDSVNFWSGLNHSARLTAYYEVRSTLIFPDAPEAKAGIVLSYGLGVGVGGRPKLATTASVQTVTLPPAMGGGTLATSLSPAEAAIGSTATPSAARVTVRGSDLGDGSAETLLFEGPSGAFEIDPVANPGWAIRLTGDSLAFVVQASAQTLIDGVIEAVPILPGVHTIGVRRRRALAVSGGPPRTSVVQSNRVPIAITADIAAVTTLAAPPRVRIDLAPGVDAVAAAADSELAIAGEVYRWHPPADPSPLVAGEYRAVSPARFEAMATFDPTDGEARLIRLGLAGVDCPPSWVTP